MASARGVALIDLIVSCSLVALIAAIAIPTLHAAREYDAARMAARYLATRIHGIRLDALKRNRNVALRFDPGVPGRFEAFVDGDGDGVLQTDVDAGIDLPLSSSMHLSELFRDISFRVVSDVPEPDGSGMVTAGSDPLRLGSSNFLSFSPLGSSTSGTLYVAATGGPQLCVRVLGPTGRIRVLSYRAVEGRWWRE